MLDTVDSVNGVWCLLFFVLPLIRVIVGPLSMAALVNVDYIDLGLVELRSRY